MPFKFDNVPINNPQLDKRVKLTEEDKSSIIEEHKAGASIHSLSRKYKVSRRLIQFTVYPERKETAKKMFAERQKDGRYYDKDKHKDYMKSHRDHKKDLWDKGLMEDKHD